MQHPVTLCDLRPGETARVRALYTEGGMRRRLTDIGLIPGSRGCCVGRSPGGDPAAYGIRGAIIAIRDEDARLVQVEREEAEQPWD